MGLGTSLAFVISDQPAFCNHSRSGLAPIWGFDMLLTGHFPPGLSLAHGLICFVLLCYVMLCYVMLCYIYYIILGFHWTIEEEWSWSRNTAGTWRTRQKVSFIPWHLQSRLLGWNASLLDLVIFLPKVSLFAWLTTFLLYPLSAFIIHNLDDLETFCFISIKTLTLLIKSETLKEKIYKT